MQRALAVNPRFSVTDETAPVVAEICCRLDGLPLAIELAAARCRLLPPAALLQRLEHRIETLRSGLRDLPPRQQTLRAAIDWSFQLLDEPVRELFHRLAVFSGGWTLEAAEAVCDPQGSLEVDALDAMTALVDASLIRQIVRPEGEPRFGMLQTIREFASELPSANGDAAIARRHAGYYLALAKEASGGLRSAQRRPWIQRLEDEHDNCRAALAWSLSPAGDLAVGESLVEGLSWFWEIAGHHDEGREWMGRFVAAG
jgi:predicted ATPase